MSEQFPPAHPGPVGSSGESRDTLAAGPVGADQVWSGVDVSSGVEVLGSEPPKKRRGRGMGVVGVSALTVAALIGGGTWAVGALGGGGDQPEQHIPAAAMGYVEVDLNPSLGQKVGALRFARTLPDVDDKNVQDDSDLRKVLYEGITEDVKDAPKWSQAEAWVGERAAVAVLPGTVKEPLEPIAVIAVTDEAKARADLGRIHQQEVFFTIRNGWAVLARTKAIADRVAGTTEGNSLAGNETFKQDVGRLGDAGIASAWFDGPQLAAAVKAYGEQQMKALQESFEDDDSGLTLGGTSGGVEGAELTAQVKAQLKADLEEELKGTDDKELKAQLEEELKSLDGLLLTDGPDEQAGSDIDDEFNDDEFSGDVDGDLGGDLPMFDPFAGLDQLTDDLGHGAATLRFDGPQLELAVATTGGKMDPSPAGTGLDELPADSLVAVSAQGLGKQLTDAWPALSKSVYGAMAKESGLDLPQDLAALLGERTQVVVAKGETADTPGFGVRVVSQDSRLPKALDAVTALTKDELPLQRKNLKDGYVLANNAKQADALSAGEGGLGGVPGFTDVLPELGSAQSAMFLDLAGLGDLDGMDANDAKSLKALGGAGLTGRTDADGVSHISLRIGTR
jgi:hypothetical protein